MKNIFFRYYKGNEIPPDDSRLKRTIMNGPAADKLTESKVTLKVPKCTKDDTGEYTLKLKNKWGSAECSVSSKIDETINHRKPLFNK
jgi:hypothetical protein